jgi:monovalent cation:proton antiporter-2 (CPA2) family protein
MPFLTTLVILLAAAVLAVPLAKRLGFGSVLGYLGAGLVIGPAGLRLVTDVASITEASELGVVMLLFLIGLELRPARLWVMRRSVFALGGAQVAVTAATLGGIGHLLGLSWPAAIVIGFGLALSSTAIVLPLFAERDLLTSHAGRDAFSVLLFQDLAVIPFVALIPLLDGDVGEIIHHGSLLAALQAAGAILAVLIGGRFLIRPIFLAVDRAKTPEIFTATALLIVIGTAALVSAVGLSMSLGAFLAGVVLSDSEYRHEIRADIEPFEGLLLGIFFVSVGMSADLGLMMSQPLFILAAMLVLLVVKGVIGFVLARIGRENAANATRFSFALSQGSEFTFVLLGVAVGDAVMSPAQAATAKLVVTLSMIATPLIFALEERFLAPRLGRKKLPAFDVIDQAATPVIICGFGRVGQIIARILRLRGIPFTALDKSAVQIENVRRFGAKAYYGDPTRVELLRSAGAEEAKLIVVAVDSVPESLKVVQEVQRHFPHLVILARARDRHHAHLLMDLGVPHIVRETFHSSLRMTEQVLAELGIDEADIRRTIALFQDHDEKTLIAQQAIHRDEKAMIQTQKQAAEELRTLFEADRAGQ